MHCYVDLQVTLFVGCTVAAGQYLAATCSGGVEWSGCKVWAVFRCFTTKNEIMLSCEKVNVDVYIEPSVMCCVFSLCCISPVLAASLVKGCQVTIGSDQGTASAIEQMGAKHVNKNVTVSIQCR